MRGRGEEGVEVSHLLVFYDTLVFCESSLDQLTYLNWLFMWFGTILGLRVNLEKSELIPMRRVDNLEELAKELGCKVSVLPLTYLVLPLGALFKFVAVWDNVEEKFQKRLALWKRQYIF